MKSGTIHIARNGSVLGAFEREKVGDMLDTGYFQPTDYYYDESRAEWQPLSSLELEDKALYPPPPQQPSPVVQPQKFKLPSEKPDDDDANKSTSRSGRRSSKAQSKAKKKTEATLAGWIACLFALGVAAGLWAWSQQLNDHLKSSEENVRELRLKITKLQNENQLLTEITPSGHIRGIITYEPSNGQVAIMSGATVGLYRRKDVEKALATVLQSNETSTSEGFEWTIEQLKAAISSPLEITLTDSNGRFDMAVPKEGEFVIVASAAKSSDTGTERYFWLIGFVSNNQPSSLLLLNESNAISIKRPQFAITNVRALGANLDDPQPSP